MRISDWSSDVCSSDLYIIVKSDSPYKAISDLKGKTLALTSASSTSGNLIPKVELGNQLKTKLSEFFGSTFYAGGHTAAQLAVLQGKADAAAVADVTLDWSVDSMKIDAKTFRILWRSEEHTSELQSLMRISYAVFCLKK